MTKHPFARSVLATLGLFFVFASSGYTDDVLYHGSLCNPASGFEANQAFYNQFGVTTIANSLLVICGVGLPFGSLDIEAVIVSVYDRNASQGVNVSCALNTVALDGTLISTETRSSSGAFVPVQFLEFIPSGGPFATTISLQCMIPPVGELGFSHVTTYRVIFTP
jgi:hypothetical protein